MTTPQPDVSAAAQGQPGSDQQGSAQDEVVDLARELIRMDTSNFGDGSGPGERQAAEWVMEKLDEVGISADLFESEKGRASVVFRIEGEDQSRDALMIHGHLDVVPAQKADWSVDPFAAEIAPDPVSGLDCLWGRGAVDMKDMDAMMLAVIRQLAREGRRPPRDLVVGFFADEEAGGVYGSHWLVENHRELFDGVSDAVSEVGGFSIDVDGQRCYLIQNAEKGIRWLRLVAHGRAGHGSQINTDNAVTRLAGAVSRIGAHQWPLEITPTVRAFLDGITEITGVEFDPGDPAGLLDRLGTTARWVGATLQNTANPTVLEAGYKQNVIPGTATALLDCRYLAGQEEILMNQVRELAGEGVDVELVHGDVALDAPMDRPIRDVMVQALLAEDPGAKVLPYCLSGGTDNKALSLLGIHGYGFAPLQLPAGMDFSGMFHGVDERVPVDALRFGTRVLERFITSS